MGLDLKGSVSLDGSGFESGIRRLEGSVHHFASEMKVLALEAFGVAAAGEMIKRTGEYAKQLVNEAKRLGTDGVEGLQVLAQAAKDGGTDIESLTGAFEKLDIAREKALSGGKDSQKYLNRFAQLGIGVEQLQSMTASQLFQGPMAKAAHGMNSEDLGPILRDIFGKAFGTMIPVLTTDFEELQKKMEGLGAIMSTSTAVQLKHLGDEFDLLRNILIVHIAPHLLTFAEWVVKAIGWIQGAIAGLSNAKNITKNYGGAFAMTTRASEAQVFVQEYERRGVGSAAQYVEEKKILADFDAATDKVLEGGNTYMEKWTEQIKEQRKKMEDETNRLLHPVAPAFDSNITEARPAETQKLKAGDKWQQIGAFMTGTDNAIVTIARRQEAHARATSENTREIRDILKGRSAGSGGFGVPDP